MASPHTSGHPLEGNCSSQRRNSLWLVPANSWHAGLETFWFFFFCWTRQNAKLGNWTYVIRKSQLLIHHDSKISNNLGWSKQNDAKVGVIVVVNGLAGKENQWLSWLCPRENFQSCLRFRVHSGEMTGTVKRQLHSSGMNNHPSECLALLKLCIRWLRRAATPVQILGGPQCRASEELRACHYYLR